MKRRELIAAAVPLLVVGNAAAKPAGHKLRHTEEAGGFKLTVTGSVLEVRRRKGKLIFRLDNVLYSKEGNPGARLPEKLLNPSGERLFVPMQDSSYRIIDVEGFD